VKHPSRRHRSPRVSTRKCVQIVGQGIPCNFSNEDARTIVVTDLDGQYCARSVFKAHRKAHPDHPARHRINSQNRIVADE